MGLFGNRFKGVCWPWPGWKPRTRGGGQQDSDPGTTEMGHWPHLWVMHPRPRRFDFWKGKPHKPQDAAMHPRACWCHQDTCVQANSEDTLGKKNLASFSAGSGLKPQPRTRSSGQTACKIASPPARDGAGSPGTRHWDRGVGEQSIPRLQLLGVVSSRKKI